MADINTTITDQISRLDGAAKIIKQKTVELGLSKNDTLDGAGVISLGDRLDVQARAIEKIEKQTINETVVAQNQEISIPKGYYDGTGKVIVKIPDGSVGEPKITVSNTGLITATSIVSEGYVKGGQSNNTEQLPVKSAETIIPGTEDKTISKLQYLIGNQTIKGVSINVDETKLMTGTTASIVSGGKTITTTAGSLVVNYYKTSSTVPTIETSGENGDLILVI